MIIQHDIIDRRKVVTVADAKSSATFRDGLKIGLTQKMLAFDQEVGVPGASARYLAAPMLAYFYRGLAPQYRQSDNEIDLIAAQMIEAVHQSPHLSLHKALAKHNVWSADIVAAVVLNLLLPEPPPPPPGQGQGQGQQGQSNQQQNDQGQGGGQGQQQNNPNGDQQGDGQGGGNDQQQGEGDQNQQQGGGGGQGDRQKGDGKNDQQGQGGGGGDQKQDGDGKPDDGKGKGDQNQNDDGQSGKGDPKESGKGSDGDPSDEQGKGGKDGEDGGSGADTEVRDLVTRAMTAQGGDQKVAFHEYVKRVNAKLAAAEHQLNSTHLEAGSVTVADSRTEETSGRARRAEEMMPTLTEIMQKTKGQQAQLTESPIPMGEHLGMPIYLDAKRVADRLGRLQSIMTGAMADRVKYAPSTPVKITMGNDLSLALKHQFVHLDQPTEPLLVKQWLGHELMQREVTGIVRAGKGPIIMCIDVSGSMWGVKMEWAFALAGAIGWAAAKRKREVCYIYYSNTVPDILHIPSKLRNDRKALDEAIGSVVHNIGIGSQSWHPFSMIPTMQEKRIGHIAPHIAGTPWEKVPNGGGTEYWTALEAAICVMLTNKAWRNADVLFLSDGADSGTYRHQAREEAERRQRVAAVKGGAKAPAKRNVLGRRENVKAGMEPGQRFGRTLVQNLNKMGARVYGIGLVQTSLNPQEARREVANQRDRYARSMGYFDAHLLAAVNEQTEAADVLRVIGSNL